MSYCQTLSPPGMPDNDTASGKPALTYRMAICVLVFLLYRPAVSAPAPDSISVQFVDVASQIGLSEFRNISGTPAQRYIVEAKSGGSAFFDYDHDGDSDLYVVNGSRFEGFEDEEYPRNRLYRNDNGHFPDVTCHLFKCTVP